MNEKSYPKIINRVKMGGFAILALAFGTVNMNAQTHPRTGVGLGGFSYWTAHYPFADCMKQASQWRVGQGGGVGADVPAANIDANGYVHTMPSGVSAVTTILAFENTPIGGAGSATRSGNNIIIPGGDWVVTWSGNGTVELLGRTGTVGNPGPGVTLKSGSDAERRKVYTITAGTEVALTLSNLGSPYPTDIKVWLPGLEGNLFNSAWINSLKLSNGNSMFDVLRFMDWNATNHSTATNWPGDRRLRSYRTYVGDGVKPGGVPYEVMLDLCNTLNAHIWINVPERANNDYVTKLANLIRYGDERG